MKIKNKIFILMINLFSLNILNGCSFESLLSEMNNALNGNYYSDEIGSIHEYGTHEDTGDSIELLSNAFNSKVDNLNNSLIANYNDITYEENEKRIQINKILKDYEFWENCTPSTGNVYGLVVPVDFIDYKAESYNSQMLKPDYQSVSSYYYNSSYGKLNFQFDVMDWFTLSHKSTYYSKMTERNQRKYYGEVPGVSAIIDEVLTALENHIDLTKYDNNKDGYIDSLYIIYNHPIEYNYSDFWWAFQYYNLNEMKFDGVIPYNYVFASYDFLFENKDNCNARTYIHETGHLLGLEDYYDYDNSIGCNFGGLGGADMMDATVGDHNPFSKMLLGWVKNPILVSLNSKESIEVKIKPFSENGDLVLISDNFDLNKGTFQNYFIIDFYDCLYKLNYNEIESIRKSGIRVYKVNGELKTYTDEYGDYQYFQYNNTDTMINLIDTISNKRSYNNGMFLKSEYDTFCASDSDFYSIYDTGMLINENHSETEPYYFKVIKIENETQEVTIRIYKN